MANDWSQLLGMEPTLPYNGIPKYQQIAAQIRVGILSNDMQPDDELPAVTDLAEIYGVTRVTARSAYGVLETAGYVVVEHGRLPYVAGGTERKPLARPKPKSDALAQENIEQLLDALQGIEDYLRRIAEALDPEGKTIR